MISIRSWLPHPWLSAFMLSFWLILNNSLALGHILIGMALVLPITGLTARIWPTPVLMRRPGLLLRYLGRLLWDIVIANLQVARLILTRPAQSLRPCFILLPLDLQDEWAIAVLAATITLTPGTVVIEMTPDRRQLLIHGLDVENEAALIAVLKNRYETLLMEIFAQC
jgi:multicomponent K+:H+ antiporter subunit E